jgi:hypothetical protein
MAVAEVHVRSWQAGYRGLIAQDFLDGLRPAEWAGRYSFDAERGGRLTLVGQGRVRTRFSLGADRQQPGPAFLRVCGLER